LREVSRDARRSEAQWLQQDLSRALLKMSGVELYVTWPFPLQPYHCGTTWSYWSLFLPISRRTECCSASLGAGHLLIGVGSRRDRRA